MLLLLVAITLLPLADAFKGQGMLRRAKTVVKGIPAALRDIVNDIDVRVILEESTAEPAPEVFWTATQPEKEPVLEVLQICTRTSLSIGKGGEWRVRKWIRSEETGISCG